MRQNNQTEYRATRKHLEPPAQMKPSVDLKKRKLKVSHGTCTQEKPFWLYSLKT